MPRRPLAALRPLLLTAALLATGAVAAQPVTDDPRVGLRAGWQDAEQASYNLELVAHVPKPEGFFNPTDPGDFSMMNSDLAFRGDVLFLGSFEGLQVWSIADPAHPVLRATLPCPGGQGDVSVLGNLLFMSVEETRGRVDCGPQGVAEPVSADRFRGVRVYDIADVTSPRQVAAVQTCRGSHTHTLVPDANDASHVFIYVSGTSGVRPGEELAGCSSATPVEDPDSTSYFRIEVIEVSLAHPEAAHIVNAPRIFADAATGNPAGLWNGGNHGEGTQQSAQTNSCHDITVYPEIGLAAGACAGNGILLDISDPANPRRLAQHQVRDAQSEAEFDPHALLWWPATGLLVVPMTDGALALRVGADGLTPAGRITQPDPIRRSLVIGGDLWTLSDTGLQASELSTLDRVAWVPFA